LEIGTGARGFIPHGTEGNFTFHVGQGEQTALVGLDDVLVESGCGLWAKLVTRVDVLGWGALTRHVGGGTIEHGVGTAVATVRTTGLGIYENFISRLNSGESTRILNYRKARLKLICHFIIT
tara:strand:- start:3540 stop:3905 length:366 start_codon:yes stop_codon:yes gene_type:complete